MKNPLTVAAVQFEMVENEKAANLATMAVFIAQAAARGADVLAFPEMCSTGYHFVFVMAAAQIGAIAESTTDGPTVRFLAGKAHEHGTLERSDEGAFYYTAVVIGSNGPIIQHRKIHAFENLAIDLPAARLDMRHPHLLRQRSPRKRPRPPPAGRRGHLRPAPDQRLRHPVCQHGPAFRWRPGTNATPTRCR